VPPKKLPRRISTTKRTLKIVVKFERFDFECLSFSKVRQIYLSCLV
jgi:hypothetical protein